MTNMKPKKHEIVTNIGICIKETLFLIICGKLTLLKKKGQVAPKCVSARSKIVMKTNCVSKLGKVYNTVKYKSGKSIGNLTKKTSFFKKVLNINLIQTA